MKTVPFFMQLPGCGLCGFCIGGHGLGVGDGQLLDLCGIGRIEGGHIQILNLRHDLHGGFACQNGQQSSQMGLRQGYLLLRVGIQGIL